jgi:gamma-glutamyltranspeptidase / glutathione hydrolase
MLDFAPPSLSDYDPAMRIRTAVLVVIVAFPLLGQRTQKPPLHGAHWMAITGKPLAATAGSMMFQKGGNAVDAACAMLAATCTMWDTLSWGGETQALIYDPHTKKVIGINALGVAPSGATAAFYHSKGLAYPPEYGPLAAVTPGTPGGLLVMLAEYGKLSLKDVLAPAIQMADGFPIEAQSANGIERQKSWIKQWPYARAVMLPYLAGATSEAKKSESSGITPSHDAVTTAPVMATSRREAPRAGEIFRQPDLAATLRKLVDAEQQALKKGASRKEAIYAAYDRFYKGDIAQEIARGTQEQGGLITTADLAKWKVKTEEPVKTTYKGIDVYKLTVWTQGPSMLQALNILEQFDLQSMGYNSARYIHTLYQALNLAYADRDFYYGDPSPEFPPHEPVLGLLSKEYARDRAKLVNPDRNDPNIGPGDPYPYQHDTNPFLDVLRNWNATATRPRTTAALEHFDESFRLGTTSIEAADEEGWVVSVTPSGGWIPAVIAGKTGVGLSQRGQSFDTDPAQNPFNVIEPGKRPHVTLTPTLAMKDGAPYLAFAVQGGDTQDQNLLQFFLNIVEFGMTPQEATEAANFNTFQVRKWLGDRQSVPGRILLNDQTPSWVRNDLRRMGYDMTFEDRTSGPINAIWLDREHGTMWGGSSNHGEDYGIAW